VTTGWRPTAALLSASGAGMVLLFAGVALHRPDLIALAAPLLCWLAVQLARPGPGKLAADVRPAASTLFENQATAVVARVETPRGTDALTVSFVPGPWLATVHSGDVVVAPQQRRTTAEIEVVARRWSRASIGTLRITAWAAQGLFFRDIEVTGRRVRVLPYRERFSVTDALPITTGVVGTHRSRRPGEGTDLAGVRPFQVGDRLRRINWPVSLRTGELHVTATVTDLDATVMIVVDSSTDLAPDADDPAEIGGTLDTAVHAAASIAEHYLRAGDRVGILDDGQTMRTVLPATGRAHLDRIVDALLDVDTTVGRRREPVSVARLLARTAPRAMVILITPLLEQARPELAVEIARAGHPVLVIDTLGAHVPAGPPDSPADLAWRLQRLQHDFDIDRLADAGIPVVAWHGAGSLNTVLLKLSRAAAAPRVTR
jgi:uncharacterized protein (DUF58 family)